MAESPAKQFNLKSNFVKFCIASGLNIGLIFLGTWFGHEILKLDATIAYSITIILVFFVNFFSLRYFVYPEANQETDAKRQAILTAVSSLGFRIIEMICFYIIHDMMGVMYLLTILFIQPIAFIIKFVFYRWVVFLPNRFVRRKH